MHHLLAQPHAATRQRVNASQGGRALKLKRKNNKDLSRAHQESSKPQSAMTTGRRGRFDRPTSTCCRRSTRSKPSSTRPNTTCRPSSQGVSTVVMKNCSAAQPAGAAGEFEGSAEGADSTCVQDRCNNSACCQVAPFRDRPGCRWCWGRRWPWTGCRGQCASAGSSRRQTSCLRGPASGVGWSEQGRAAVCPPAHTQADRGRSLSCTNSRPIHSPHGEGQQVGAHRRWTCHRCRCPP